MLHKFANSAKAKNGIDMSKLTGKEISMSQSVALKDASVKADTSVIPEGTLTRYEVESGNLPDGVTLNKDGTLSGKPSVSGKYEVTIATKAVSAGPFLRTQTYNFYNTQTINVKEKESKDPVDDKPIETPIKTKQDNTLAVAGLVTGIIGILVGIGAMLTNFFKRK